MVCALIGLSLCLAVPAVAGEYHVNGYLTCSDCHTMHYSQQHSYNGSPTQVVFDPTGPFAKLLKADPNHLCLACHDTTSFAPDVFGANTTSFVRQAGGLNDPTIDRGYFTYDGHTLGSTATAPGGAWSHSGLGLMCIDCHSPHGIMGQYRNLWTSDDPANKFFGKAVTYAIAQNDLSKDVFLPVNGFGMEARYGTRYVKFNEPDQTKSAYGAWCASCHPNFHGSGGSDTVGGAHGGNSGSSPWLRHPAADVNIGQNDTENSSLAHYQSHTNRVQVMSATGNWQTGSDVTPSCFSCHKAHGNKNAFALIYMRGAGSTLTEEGDAGTTGKPIDLCLQCHVQ